MTLTKSPLFPDHWKPVYENGLESPEDVGRFIMEGDGAVTFPMKRMRLESTRHPDEGQLANVVFWCPVEFPQDMAVSWNFWPLREPGLAILFFSAKGTGGEDLFDPRLAPRQGIYDQYHHGDIHAYHLSYFRRRYAEERQFHTCNLRKSYGFHLVAQGADPIPGVADAAGPYRMLIVKQGSRIRFAVNEMVVLAWEDDGSSYGPLLSGGKIGFRQMAPFIGEYADLKVYGDVSQVK